MAVARLVKTLNQAERAPRRFEEQVVQITRHQRIIDDLWAEGGEQLLRSVNEASNRGHGRTETCSSSSKAGPE